MATFETVFNFGMLGLLAVFPLVLMTFLLVNRKRLAQESFKRKYGTYYTGLGIRTDSNLSLLFPLIFMLRRLILALVAIFLANPGLQIVAFYIL